jgi:hypothetical protein
MYSIDRAPTPLHRIREGAYSHRGKLLLWAAFTVGTGLGNALYKNRKQ